jgi:SAM-dependent methyltransferase
VSPGNSSRWQVAQEYELNWWKRYDNDVEWYQVFSQEVQTFVKPYLEINKETKILEIGAGPAGALTSLPSNHKYAIDPLEDYFSTRKEWTQIRDPKVLYQTGKGEALPYQDDFFDLIIIDNALDHCENPILVLDEIHRVLKKGGVIFFRQSVYHWWGRWIRKVVELMALDKGHPFTFGKMQLIEFFKMRSWEIKAYQSVGYIKTWIENFRLLTAKGLMKALLLANHDRTTFVLQKF